ncbi:GerAB/ArcD/ProY family transporter [Neobacillus sp. DY30]|uniref:GerAB/ArcD/ProY family transporter n=1 Tax=Neobacillus sp. DY30 TaxID=3047871 RepID=UPI0024C073D1|nr:GerAB/ArcD/ProY family transporter [Neobacillus sp. DY30]WHX98579.1 GerAB/ArcD/ProY family transporter [Neobacillus sp. DY30]
MKQQTGKIGVREFVSIAVLMVGSKATEDTPDRLYSNVQNAAWMIPFISAGIFFIPLYLLMKTMALYGDKDLFSVIKLILGKYLGFLVCLVIFIISSFAVSFDTRTYSNIIRSFYFTTTPTIIIYAILMFICGYGAKKGLQHIGSVSYLIVFYAVLSLYLALLLGTQHANIDSMFPIWGPGPLALVKEGSQRLTLFADFFLLTMVIPYLTSNKAFKKGTWFAYIYVCIQISLSLLTYICMFDESLGGVAYPFHTVIRFISLGQYIPNVEIIFFIIWIMAAFIRFTAFLYINALMFGHLFKINDFEYLIPSLATIFLMIGMLPEAPIDVSLVFKPIVVSTAGPMFAVISTIVWLVALIKGEFKHAKNKNSM